MSIIWDFKIGVSYILDTPTPGSAGRWPALNTAWAGQRPALPGHAAMGSYAPAIHFRIRPVTYARPVPVA